MRIEAESDKGHAIKIIDARFSTVKISGDGWLTTVVIENGTGSVMATHTKATND